MAKKSWISLIITFLVVGLLGWQYFAGKTPATSEPAVKQIFPGGKVGFSYPEDVFGFAVAEYQILVESFIPPCDSPFDYCVYYISDEYADTNFESAGVRMKRRTDLSSETACLNTPPAGYTNLTPLLPLSEQYATAMFGPLGNAAAGHYSNGALYRLFHEGVCYEFETRIGESQFLNYEPGTIKEFTEADRKKVESLLREVIDSVVLTDGNRKVFFPQ